MPKNNQEHLEAYQESHKRVEDYEGTHDLIAKSKVVANKESIVEHAATMEKIRGWLGKARAKEADVVADAQKFAGQNNPDNTQMYLDAYNEYFDYLASQESVPDGQVSALVARIDSLESLLKSEKLRVKMEQHPIPAEVLQKINAEELEQVKAFFVEIVTQRIADLGGMALADGFKNEELDQFWQQALTKFETMKNAEASEPEESEDIKPTTGLPSPARLIRANPGWTGFYPGRGHRNVRASKGIRSGN